MENILEFPDRSRIEEEASQWIVRFEGDEPPTREDIEALKAWMGRSPAHREVLMQYASTWNDMDLLSELMLPLGNASKPKSGFFGTLLAWLLAPVMLLAALVGGLKHLVDATPGRWATASVVLALGALAVLSPSLLFNQPGGANNIYATSIGETVSRTLADGSTLWLNTDSRVEVDYSGEKRRIVLHKGEAYFKVAKNPNRPFEVYAGTRMVRAVGTAFSVYREDHAVKVTVTEGRVDLAAVNPAAASPATRNSGANEASTGDATPPKTTVPGKTKAHEEAVTELLGSLVAGQSVVMAGDDKSIMENVIDNERRELARRLSWRDGLLVFAGEPLEEVVTEVSRYTSLNIAIADPELKTLRIGGQFQIGQTDAMFDVLESGFGLQISHLDDNHVEIRAGK